MAAFSISFDPDIVRALAPATDSWINALDWKDLQVRSQALPDLNVWYVVDGSRFCYCPDNAAGVLGELATSLHDLRNKDEATFAVQTYVVLCAQRVSDGWQFYDPTASYENGVLKPLERQTLIGPPIAQEAIEAVLREAMATLGQYMNPERA